MSLNPFDRQLESSKQKASDLSASLNSIRQELDWYEGTELAALAEQYEAIRFDLEAESSERDRIANDLKKIESNLRNLSQSIRSLWNPKNWFNAEQRHLRTCAENLKKSVDQAQKAHSQANYRLQATSLRSKSKAEEIEKYKNFDFDEKSK